MVFQARMTTSDISVKRKYLDVPDLSCYPGELQQVFTNLVSNALDALPKGGSLWVSVRPAHGGADWQRDGVRVTIADNGAGMDRNVRSRAFEPFVTTKRDTGTGLGLWLTKGIVDKHQGSIKIASAPGKGTAISIFFPHDGLNKAAA